MHLTSRNQRLHRNPGVRVHRHHAVQNCVADSVAYLVRMALRHRFRSEEIPVHGDPSLVRTRLARRADLLPMVLYRPESCLEDTSDATGQPTGSPTFRAATGPIDLDVQPFADHAS